MAPGPAIPVAAAAAGGPIWAGDREACGGAELGDRGHGPAEPLADGPFAHPQSFGDALLRPAFLE